jgi:alanine-glyoxylate transaminase/serine-glyoxylate transaminase/serine-pyruvate transaminase
MATEEDPNADGFIRFGHMGHLNAQMMLAAIATTQAGLMAIGAPLASGAVDAAAQIIAKNA